MEDINYIDIAVLALVTLLGLKGIINGFIREFFGLTGIVGGVYVASRYAESMGMWVSKNLYAFENEATINLAGFVLILAGVWIACLIFAEVLLRLVRLSALGVVDKIFGFIFASGKIFMIFSVIAYALSSIEIINNNIERYTSTSFAYPMLLATGRSIVKIDSVSSLTKRAMESGDTKLDSHLSVEDNATAQTKQ
ncbi:MAG: CvpA family protein [Wolinella sp.]